MHSNFTMTYACAIPSERVVSTQMTADAIAKSKANDCRCAYARAHLRRRFKVSCDTQNNDAALGSYPSRYPQAEPGNNAMGLMPVHQMDTNLSGINSKRVRTANSTRSIVRSIPYSMSLTSM